MNRHLRVVLAETTISGLYAHAHGVVDNFTEYPVDLKSFPLVLQSADYNTAYIGKWHMGEDTDEPRPGTGSSPTKGRASILTRSSTSMASVARWSKATTRPS